MPKISCGLWWSTGSYFSLFQEHFQTFSHHKQMYSVTLSQEWTLELKNCEGFVICDIKMWYDWEPVCSHKWAWRSFCLVCCASFLVSFSLSFIYLFFAFLAQLRWESTFWSPAGFFLSPLQLFCSGGFFLKFLSRNQKTAKKRKVNLPNGWFFFVVCYCHTFLHSCPGNEIQSFFCSQKRKLLSELFSECHQCSSRCTLLKKERKHSWSCVQRKHNLYVHKITFLT